MYRAPRRLHYVDKEILNIINYVREYSRMEAQLKIICVDFD